MSNEEKRVVLEMAQEAYESGHGFYVLSLDEVVEYFKNL